MPQIIVEDLVKTFLVAERSPGLVGAFKGLVNRSYRSIHALTGINFTLEPGELVGYIGPNGAGKSTTVKILSGILVPTSGRCEINGLTPWLDRQRHVGDIGVVFGQRTQLWWDLPVIESFELLRDIYRIPADRYQKNRDELIDILDLGMLLDMPVRQLSLGQRMRCDLVASLLHSPSILFLDEPTIGLDAVSKLAVRDFIKQLNRERGTTVILTTHDMDDIEALCNRIVVIGNGVILSDGSLDALRFKLRGERRLKIEFEDDPQFSEPEVRIISREGRVLHLGYNPHAVAATELIARITARYRVKDFLMEHPPIEELIAQLYKANEIDEDTGRNGTGLQV
jgi:ABC-2 type transport system ATP-binding protein